MLLACALTDGSKYADDHSVLKIEIDGETIFYRALTYGSTSISSQVTIGLACKDAMYFRWSNNSGSSYLPYDCANGKTSNPNNNIGFRNVLNTFSTLDELKNFEEYTLSGGCIEILDAPLRFESSLKVSAIYYHDSENTIKPYQINTRYILD